MTTPITNTFFMPAEWEQHLSTWLAWPHDPITFPDRVEKVEAVFTAIIYHLHQNELINLLVLDAETQNHAAKTLKTHGVNLDKIIFHQTDYADVWLRDYGPTFITNKQQQSWIKWRYNAYGNKFVDLLKDDQVFHELQHKIKSPMISADIFMEGGAIEVNGNGVLLTTEECLLNPNRNPTLNKNQTEEYLKKYLGVKKIIWLEKGVINDHTDGHIDEVARFVDTNTIVCAYEEDQTDPNFAILDQNWHTLQNATDQNNRLFKVIKLPMPKMDYDNDERAPVSYANFYIANNLVLVPQFNHKNDKRALEIIKEVFPNRVVVGIDCTDLIYGGGTIHCITQQEPSF
jgi:agmatine deiminase